MTFSGWFVWAHIMNVIILVPFEISGYPDEIPVELLTSYNLTCTVQVDPEFLLEGVHVWMRFFRLTDNTAREEYTNNYHINEQQRTVSYSHIIPYITERHLGTYECVAETITSLDMSNGIIPSYTVYRRGVIVQSSQSESSGKLIVVMKCFVMVSYCR